MNPSIQKSKPARVARIGDLEAGLYENIEMTSENKDPSPADKEKNFSSLRGLAPCSSRSCMTVTAIVVAILVGAVIISFAVRGPKNGQASA